MPKKLATAISVAVAIAAGLAVFAYLASLATWGGPNGSNVQLSEVPLGLLVIFVLIVLVIVGMVAKVLYELMTRR